MTQFVSSGDGTRIAYESRGAASPALVLVHGWSCDRSYWDAQVKPLSREFRVVTIDLRGHGESDAGRQEASIAHFGTDVATVVRHLGLKDVVLVGHSMGGAVILETANRLTRVVSGLIWVDTYGKLPIIRTSEEVHLRMAPFRADFVEETRRFARTMFGADADPELVERIARDMSAAPPNVAVGALEAVWTFGGAVPGLLGMLQLPLIAINPDDSFTDVDSLRAHGVDVVLMPGVGHFPMLEDPQAFNRELVRAVRIVQQSARIRHGA